MVTRISIAGDELLRTGFGGAMIEVVDVANESSVHTIVYSVYF
jgi:hypothetical protein